VVFNSFSFVLFFATVLLLYHGPLRQSWRAQKAMLLVASYVFYAAWNPPFVALLWLSTLVDWWVGSLMHRTDGSAARRGLLAVSLAVNLGMLSYFKYGAFLLENFALLVGAAGIRYVPPDWDIFLPIGISFYTFQTLSYTIDIYRRDLEPTDSFLDFALFVTFFPQLVAGPIVRASDFLPQCRNRRLAAPRHLVWGLQLLIIGLFSKVVVADAILGPIADEVYGSTGPYTSADAWAATLAFSGQIYCDFSGYSVGAIGAAMCLGFRLPDNFLHPYGAIGFSDFWRKWHISLSQWLRDYVYIPLGGNRGGRLFTYRNMMLTMLIGGIWHGAGWNFLLWGALHGGYLVMERLVKHLTRAAPIASHPIVRGLALLATFVAVTVAWVPFRASNIRTTADMLSALLGVAPSSRTLLGFSDVILTMVIIGLMVSYHAFMRGRTIESEASRLPPALRAALCGLLLFAIFTAPGNDRAFIYFQF
jgi:alginate O-acetyltransferase complex protein AlgI